jgi:hypothetical protein
MKFALTKLGIVSGLMGTLALSPISPALAWTNRPAASTDIVPYNDACEAYWMPSGYYPHYYGSSACYEFDSLYEARTSSDAAVGLERHHSSHKARRH